MALKEKKHLITPTNLPAVLGKRFSIKEKMAFQTWAAAVMRQGRLFICSFYTEETRHIKD